MPAKHDITHIGVNLLARTPLPPNQLHAMPVEAEDLEAAFRQWEGRGHKIAGRATVGSVEAIVVADGWLQGAQNGRSAGKASGY